MKIFICASKYLYGHIEEIKNELEKRGHIVTLPNSFDEPLKEEEMKLLSREEHAKWKGEMFKLQKQKVSGNDAVLVINREKNGQQNYIGGATFLEIYEAFSQGKKIYLLNPIPENNLKDEIEGMSPIIINGDLDLVK